jgi:hypothetical protein
MATDPDSDPDLDKVLLERASEAAKRWRDRKTIREERNNAVKDGRPLDADSRPRLALRLNRLINEVRSSSRDRRPPDNPTLRELIARPEIKQPLFPAPTTPLLSAALTESKSRFTLATGAPRVYCDRERTTRR